MSVPASATASDGYMMAKAVSETEMLREVVREFRRLGAAYCVGRRRPISELTPEQQVQVRQAYKDTKWSSDYGVDMMGICTSQALAEKFCRENGPNWFWTKLPIDSVLGKEPVFGEWAHVFPGSDAVEMYENMESATLAVPVTQMRAMESHTRTLEDHIHLINNEIARLQTLVQFVRGKTPRP